MRSDILFGKGGCVGLKSDIRGPWKFSKRMRKSLFDIQYQKRKIRKRSIPHVFQSNVFLADLRYRDIPTRRSFSIFFLPFRNHLRLDIKKKSWILSKQKERRHSTREPIFLKMNSHYYWKSIQIFRVTFYANDDSFYLLTIVTGESLWR